MSSHHAVKEAQTNLQIKFPNAVKDFQTLTALLELVDPPAPAPVRVNEVLTLIGNLARDGADLFKGKADRW